MSLLLNHASAVQCQPSIRSLTNESVTQTCFRCSAVQCLPSIRSLSTWPLSVEEVLSIQAYGDDLEKGAPPPPLVSQATPNTNREGVVTMVQLFSSAHIILGLYTVQSDTSCHMTLS